MSNAALCAMFSMVFFWMSTLGASCQENCSPEIKLLVNGEDVALAVFTTGSPSAPFAKVVESDAGSDIVNSKETVTINGNKIENKVNSFAVNFFTDMGALNYKDDESVYSELYSSLENRIDKDFNYSHGLGFSVLLERDSLAAIPGSVIAMIFGVFGLLLISRRGCLPGVPVLNGPVPTDGEGS